MNIYKVRKGNYVGTWDMVPCGLHLSTDEEHDGYFTCVASNLLGSVKGC